MRETGGEFVEPGGTTTPLQPIPDRIEPVNFPYRGGEMHGVAVEGRPWIPQDADEQSWEGEETYDPKDAPLEPIPVVVVNESPHETRSWRAWHHIANINPSRCVGRNERRSAIRIHNLSDTATVYVSSDANCSVYSAFPILPGANLNIDSEDEVYCLASADDTEIACLSEHTIG